MIDVQEAKNKVRQRLLQDANDKYPLIWVGDVYAETKDTLIFEGSNYSGKKDFNEGKALFAVHKENGRCGPFPPPPGPKLDKEYLEKNFSWDTWVILD